MLARLSSSFALTALLASLGCAQVLPPLTPPEAGGAPWRELTSKHVILRTDRDESDAHEALVELEHMIVALRDIAFPQVNIEKSRIVAIHFDRERDYTSFARSGTAGVFMWRLPNDLQPEPTMIVWGTLDAGARATLQHELTHMFVRSSVAGLPPWLNEGLAEYYETLAVEGGYAFVGRPRLGSRAWPQTAWRSVRSGAFVTLLVPIGHIPPVDKLVGMDAGAFYVWTDGGRQPGLDEHRQAAANYLGAYGLVHLLMHEPTYQPRYDAMMEQMAQGNPARSAWDAAFADVSPADLEDAYRKHLLNRYETTVLRTPYAHKEVETPASRVMDPSDVHLLWARLRPWGKNPVAAEAEIATAKRLAPASAEARFWSGVLNYRLQLFDAAASDMRAAIAAKPDEPRYLHGLAIVHRGQAMRPAANAQAVKDEDEAMARLAKNAVSGNELNTVADHHERRGRWDEALAFAQRAVKADPTCVACFGSLAEILFAKGDPEGAVQAQSIALSLLPDGVAAPEEEVKLRRYAAADRKKKRAAGQPAPTAAPEAPPSPEAPAPK